MRSLTRRDTFLFLAAGAGTTLFAGAARADVTKMVMHKSATCGCCSKWTEHMRKAGFVVEEVIEADMAAVKTRLGVPKAMGSCHTAELDGYLVEGHVPAQAIQQLLKERPKAIGVAAPGMPGGSPGMESAPAETYTLYLFDAAGSREFGKWLGDKPA